MDEKKKRRPKKGESKINLSRAIDLRNRGLSYGAIARTMGVQQGAILYHFKKLDKVFKEHPEMIQLYDKNKSDFFKTIQMNIGIEMLNPKKLDKASLNNLAYSIRQLYDIGRLETGQSTQNIAYADALKARDQHKATLQDLEEIRQQRQADNEMLKEGDMNGIQNYQ